MKKTHSQLAKVIYCLGKVFPVPRLQHGQLNGGQHANPSGNLEKTVSGGVDRIVRNWAEPDFGGDQYLDQQRAGWWLGPILQYALHFKNGGQVIATAAAGTGAIFFTLAGLATVTKKDFGCMGNFVFVGLILLIIASLANLFFAVPAASLAISAVAELLFSGFLLIDVSRIVNGGETNYVMATMGLYLSIYNLFTSLLHLLLAFSGEKD